MKKRKITKAKVSIKDSVINPKALKTKVADMGGALSTKDILKIMGILALIGFVLSFSAGLKLFPELLIVVGIFAASSMFFIHDKFTRDYQKKRFEDASAYAENMLYSFQDTGKILESLIRTKKIFLETSTMYKCIDKAIDKIQKGMSATGEELLYKQALACIEEVYPSKRISGIHNLLVSSEVNGGDFKSSCRILMEDRRTWVDNTSTMMQQKAKKYHETIASAIVSALLCIFCSCAYKIMPEQMNIVPNILYQISTSVTLVLLLLVVKRTSSKCNTDWVKKDSIDRDEKLIDDYEKLINYNILEKTARYAIPTAILTVVATVCVVFKFYIPAIIVGLVAGFILLIPRIEYHLLYKSCKNGLITGFPQWLIQMALLLQNNNVNNAIRLTKDSAPSILKPEIELLIDRIGNDPDNVETYTKFFEFFNIKEVTNAMRILFSMSVSGITDLDAQIAALLESTYFMQKQAEEIIAENDILVVKNMFQLPMLVSSIKLVADLGTLILVSLPALMQMGVSQ